MSKDTAILPISYFGPIEYYYILNHYNTIIETHENYQKRTVRNRSKILSANGTLKLSVPLKKGKTLKRIKDVEISYDIEWQKQHMRAITSAYQSAPYFDYYYEKIFSIISKKWKYLIELDMATLEMMRELQFVKTIKRSSDYVAYGPYKKDMRPMNTLWNHSFSAYNQVFESKYGYVNNLSILDALFNLGPETKFILTV